VSSDERTSTAVASRPWRLGPTIGPPAEEGLGDRGQDRRRERAPRNRGVAVVPLGNEEGQEGGNHALVDVIDDRAADISATPRRFTLRGALS
jgi:hypothetical protein